MKRIENGVEVELTPSEVSAWEAEQAAYVPPEPVQPVELDPVEKLSQFLKANPDVAELLK